MTIRRWVAAGLAVCAVSASLWAKPGIVKTRDGTSYQGEVTETEDGKIVIKVHGIDMRVERRDVASIQYIDDEAGDFQKKLAALPARDSKSRLDMAKSAFAQKHYDWARQAAQAALDADPNNKDASEYLTMIRKQQELEHAKPVDPNGPPATPDQPTDTPTSPADQKVLSADDINIIRQMELGAQENSFKAKLQNDVARRFTVKDNGGTLAQFTAETNQRQARLIIDRAPEMRNDVRIMTDPASMAMYKQHVQPAVLGGCATSGCHGGAQAGKFVLIAPADNEAATYTNFYILTKYTKTIDKTTHSMIDRTAPQKSLLLQYSLPADVADIKHPDIPGGYKGIFRSAADPRYKSIREWITNSLVPLAPDYGIKFTIPGSSAASPAPTTKPASK